MRDKDRNSLNGRQNGGQQRTAAWGETKGWANGDLVYGREGERWTARERGKGGIKGGEGSLNVVFYFGDSQYVCNKVR